MGHGGAGKNLLTECQEEGCDRVKAWHLQERARARHHRYFVTACRPHAHAVLVNGFLVHGRGCAPTQTSNNVFETAGGTPCVPMSIAVLLEKRQQQLRRTTHCWKLQRVKGRNHSVEGRTSTRSEQWVNCDGHPILVWSGSV